LTDVRLARIIQGAFASESLLETPAVDSIVVDLAAGLLAAERGGARPPASSRIDVRAIARARDFLDAERTRVVHSSELESVTGLTRYDLARQFKLALGTSPHRYLIMRRLEIARQRIHLGRPLVEVACEMGFADQAHFTRAFKAAFGLTPARYRALRTDRPPSVQ
jgi:AraC-like DNA-binding protein